MAISKKKMTSRVRIKDLLDESDYKAYKKLSKKRKENIKDEVGFTLNNEVNKELDQSRSPAQGGKFKKKLKDGTSSYLFDTGELRGNLLHENYRDGIEYGVFDSENAAKAYGHHTNMKGHPTLQGKVGKRQIIPEKGGNFKPKIKRKLTKKIKEFL